MAFFILLLIPLLLAFAAFALFEYRITLKEFSIQVGLQLVITGVFVGLIYFQNVHDVEVWNGVVATKARERVSCSHSYPCNCHEVSCGKNCTTTVCSTCYEHAYDIDWAVYTTNQERLTIDRLSSQGLEEPPRYTQVKLGEPTSVSHMFVNYIKGAPDTLFRHQGLVQQFANALPSYPGSIYDYYRLDRVLPVGVAIPDLKSWNDTLSSLNGALGKRKQVNMIVVVTKDKPEDYFLALEQNWLGGKKNDAVLVVNVNASNEVTWAGVIAWTRNEIFKVKLRDDVLDMKTLDRDQLFKIFQDDVEKLYIRKNWEEFSYLKASIKPSKWQWIIALVLGILSSLGLSWFFYANDEVDEKDPRNRGRSWRY